MQQNIQNGNDLVQGRNNTSYNRSERENKRVIDNDGVLPSLVSEKK